MAFDPTPPGSGARAHTYSVPGVGCEHCRAAIEDEVGPLAGVETVAVDLEAKRVTVAGPGIDDAAVREAIHAAGYDVA
jgi:copper chaperone